MGKMIKPVIPVKTTGKVSAFNISIDMASGAVYQKTSAMTGAGKIAKSSSQITDIPANVSYITPYIDHTYIKSFYEANPYLFRAIKLNAACIVGLGNDIVHINPDKENYQNEPEYLKLKNFIDNPNEKGDIFDDIILFWCEDRFTFGQGYLECVSNLKGELTELYHLKAYQTFAKMYYNKLRYIQFKGVKTAEFRPLNSDYMKEFNEVLEIKSYNPFDDYYGFPEWYTATADLLLSRSAKEYNIKRFENNLMIQFAIVCEGGELSSEAMTSIADFLRSNYKGLSNVGKVLYLNTDTPDVKIRIEKIEADVRDASFLKLIENSRDSIIAATGVLPRLVGIVSAGQLGGGGEADTQFRMFNETLVKPEQKRFAAKLNHLFKSKLSITNYKLEFKELTIESFIQFVTAFVNSTNAGITDDNEARQALGYSVRKEDTNIINKLDKLSSSIKQIRKSLNV